MAMDIDQSSPKILCHCLTAMAFILGVTEARMAFKQAIQCRRSLIVVFRVSRIQPRMNFRVSQVPSCIDNFLIDGDFWP